MSRGTALSACPTDQAKPDEVVASALKPRPCSQRADPSFHGLGIIQQPDSCSLRKVRRLSATDGRGMDGSPWSHDPEKWVPVFGQDHAQTIPPRMAHPPAPQQCILLIS